MIFINEQPARSISEHPTVPAASGSRRKHATEQVAARSRVGDTVYTEIMKIRPSEYLAHPVAKGGEHLVFTIPHRDIPGLRDVVVKINFFETVQQLKTVLSQDPNARAIVYEELKEKVAERRMQLRELRRFFGSDAIPAEQSMVRDIPVTPRLVEQFAPWSANSPVTIPETIPALLTIQRRLDLTNDQKSRSVSLNGSYPEYLPLAASKGPEVAARIYDEAHDLLVGRIVEGDPHIREQMLCLMYPKLRQVARHVASDPSFATKLRDTVDRLVTYSNETGIALDLVGVNNLLLLKEKEKWQLKMPDPLLFGDQKFKNLEDVSVGLIRRAQAGEALDLSAEDVRDVFNVLNTVRVINALAILSGSRRRVQVKWLNKIPPSVWREGIRRKLFSTKVLVAA